MDAMGREGAGVLSVSRQAVLFALALMPALPVVAQSQSAWHAARGGVEVKANALTRPAVLAFYQARGFSAEAIAPYADACVFSFEVRNTTKKPLRLRLADWRAEDGAGRARFGLPDAWEAEWARRVVGATAVVVGGRVVVGSPIVVVAKVVVAAVVGASVVVGTVVGDVVVDGDAAGSRVHATNATTPSVTPIERRHLMATSTPIMRPATHERQSTRCLTPPRWTTRT